MSQDNNNTLDFGITTGSVATASSLAALMHLFKNINSHEVDEEDKYYFSNDLLKLKDFFKSKQLSLNDKLDCVQITVPYGDLNIEVNKLSMLSDNTARAVVVKNNYDDPDITIGLEIVSTVKLLKENSSSIGFNNENFAFPDSKTIKNSTKDNDKYKVKLFAGEGVGVVTKQGLQVPVGFPAINPVPQRTIRENILNYLPEGYIAEVVVSIPRGMELSKKTMNPKLGIIGGLSILGTTGIARPMSTKAYQDSLACQIDVALAQGFENPIFVPGNIGEKIAIEKFNAENDEIVQMSNFVGFMFEEAEKRGIKELTLIGHIGKLIKIAGGIFNTKYTVADARKEIMVTHAAINHVKTQVLLEIYSSNTTEDMTNILKRENIDKEVFKSIMLSIKKRCEGRFDIKFNVILVDIKGNILSSSFDK